MLIKKSKNLNWKLSFLQPLKFANLLHGHVCVIKKKRKKRKTDIHVHKVSGKYRKRICSNTQFTNQQTIQTYNWFWFRKSVSYFCFSYLFMWIFYFAKYWFLNLYLTIMERSVSIIRVFGVVTWPLHWSAYVIGNGVPKWPIWVALKQKSGALDALPKHSGCTPYALWIHSRG